jgi:hypothetical protein
MQEVRMDTQKREFKVGHYYKKVHQFGSNNNYNIIVVIKIVRRHPCNALINFCEFETVYGNPSVPCNWFFTDSEFADGWKELNKLTAILKYEKSI